MEGDDLGVLKHVISYETNCSPGDTGMLGFGHLEGWEGREERVQMNTCGDLCHPSIK